MAKKKTESEKMLDALDNFIYDDNISVDERIASIKKFCEKEVTSGKITKYVISQDENEELQEIDFRCIAIAWIDANGELFIWSRQVEMDDPSMYVGPEENFGEADEDDDYSDEDVEYMSDEEEELEEEEMLDDATMPCPYCKKVHTLAEYMQHECCPSCKKSIKE